MFSGRATAVSPRATCAEASSNCATFRPTSTADDAAGAIKPRSSSLASDTVAAAPLAPSAVGGLPSIVVSSASRPAAPSTSA
ncbi:hypothetical protein D9M68_940430 [compost metagenome]